MVSDTSTKDDKTGTGVLDLGLTAMSELPSDTESVPTPTEAPPLDPPPLPVVDDSIEAMFARGEFEKVSRVAEKTLEQESEDPAARLWWIRAQSRLREVPLGMLQAPLETVCSHTLGNDSPEELKRLTLTTLHELGHAMIESGDPRGSLPLLLRAFDCEHVLTEDLATALRREISFLETVKDYENEELNAKKLEQYRSMLKGVISESETSTLVDSPVAPESQYTAQLAPKVRGGLNVGTIVLGLLLLLAVGLGVKHFIFSEEEEVVVDATSLPQVVARNEIPHTMIPREERASKFNNLDALYYEIESGSKKQDTPPAEVARVQPREPNPKNEGGAYTQAAEAQPSEREVINTTGPVETRRDRLAEHDDEIENRDRSSNDNLFGGIKNPRSNIFSDRSKEYGLGVPDAQRRQPDDNDGSNRNYPGPRPLPVEKLDQPVEYRVIARTSVLSRPSFTAVERTVLERGDRVVVTARIGDWFKIRSKSGDPGYIFSQDAVKSR